MRDEQRQDQYGYRIGEKVYYYKHTERTLTTAKLELELYSYVEVRVKFQVEIACKKDIK